MTILLTGASGFTGSHLYRLMQADGLAPRCLARRSSDVTGLQDVVHGDIGDAGSLARAFEGVDTLINTASIGFGHAPVLVEAAERAGVKRAIFISTTALFTQLNASSKSVRIAAEDRIRASSLQWTIIRPTMIYGTARDRNMVRLIRVLRRWPVIPVVGDGNHLQQPIYVDDVGRAVLGALRHDVTIGKAYNVAGREPLTFNAVIDTITRLLGRRVRKVHVPVAPVVATLAAIERTGLKLPVKSEQILRLNENKAFPYDDAARDFSYAPMSFEEGIRLEIESLGFTHPAARFAG